MKKRVFSIFVVIVLILSLSSCHNGLAHITKKWVPEQDDSVAILSQRDSKVFVGGIWYDYNIAYERYYGEKIFFSVPYSFICVKEHTLYGICQEFDTWDLYQIDLKSNTLEVIYSAPEVGYGKLMAYSDNGIIYINDRIRTVTYDIQANSIQELSNEDFVKPDVILNFNPASPNQIYKCNFTQEYDLEITRIGDEGIAAETRVITFDYIADRHVYFDQIRESYSNKVKIPGLTYSPSELEEKFTLDAQVMENKIYLSVNVYDSSGSATNVILRYDYEADVFYCLHHEFTFDYGLCRVVPVY